MGCEVAISTVEDPAALARAFENTRRVSDDAARL